MLEMYEAKINSPTTHLTYNIDANQTTINVQNTSVLPDAPNLATIGTGEDAETILYNGKTSTTLTGITRGFEGDAKPWSVGTKISRNYTAYDHNSMKNNIGILNEKNNTFGYFSLNEEYMYPSHLGHVLSTWRNYNSMYNLYYYAPKNGNYKIHFLIKCINTYNTPIFYWRAILNNNELVNWIQPEGQSTLIFEYNCILYLNSQNYTFFIQVKSDDYCDVQVKYIIRQLVFIPI